jgi:hypothetical protein
LKHNFYLVTIENLGLYLVANSLRLRGRSLAAGESNRNLITQSPNILQDNAGVVDVKMVVHRVTIVL